MVHRRREVAWCLPSNAASAVPAGAHLQCRRPGHRQGHLDQVDAAFSAGSVTRGHVALLVRTARQVGVEHVAASQVSVAPTIYGMVAVNGMLDPASGEVVLAALDAVTDPPREGDLWTAGQRRADALTELCRCGLGGGALPQVNGEKPHVVVTESYEALLGQLGGDPARLGWAGPISGTDARLWACDCSVIPAVLDGAGEVLDIGRRSRVWPTAIRRAIELRDRTCRHIGCDGQFTVNRN